MNDKDDEDGSLNDDDDDDGNDDDGHDGEDGKVDDGVGDDGGDAVDGCLRVMMLSANAEAIVSWQAKRCLPCASPGLKSQARVSALVGSKMSIDVPLPLTERHERSLSSRREICPCAEHEAPERGPANAAAPSSRGKAKSVPTERRAGTQYGLDRSAGPVKWRRVSHLD